MGGHAFRILQCSSDLPAGEERHFTIIFTQACYCVPRGRLHLQPYIGGPRGTFASCLHRFKEEGLKPRPIKRLFGLQEIMCLG
jgi:hypothetical protein